MNLLISHDCSLLNVMTMKLGKGIPKGADLSSVHAPPWMNVLGNVIELVLQPCVGFPAQMGYALDADGLDKYLPSADACFGVDAPVGTATLSQVVEGITHTVIASVGLDIVYCKGGYLCQLVLVLLMGKFFVSHIHIILKVCPCGWLLPVVFPHPKGCGSGASISTVPTSRSR